MGAGPTGLFAAAELARRGVPVRIVEREVVPHVQVRASSIQARTIEILEAIGMHEPVLERSHLVVAASGFDQSLNLLYRTPFSGADTSYPHICILPQWETEAMLQRQCDSLGVTVERGVAATLVEVGAADALVSLEHADGRVEEVRPAYLLDATGAHSQARKALHEHLEGETYRGTFAVADCLLDTTLPRDTSSLVTGSGHVLFFIPLPDERWLVTVEVRDGSTSLSDDELASRLHEWSGGTVRLVEAGWRSVFHTHHRIAEHLGDGRHFLLGDAGHLSSPFGGEGLNAGLHDSYDIAWKLDLVLRGRALPSILDTYTLERTIADEHVIKVSDLAHNASIAMAREPENRAAPPDEATIAAAVSSRFMLDIDYSASPIVLVDAAQPVSAPLPGHRLRDWSVLGTTDHVLLVFGTAEAPDELAAFGARWHGTVEVRSDHPIEAGSAGVSDRGLVLLRPDGHVAARRAGTTADDVAALDGHLATFLLPQ